MKFLAFSQTKLGSSLALPANGLGGSRATSLLVAHFALQNTASNSAEKKNRPREGVAEFEAMFCKAKCATIRDVVLDTPNPFAGNAKELPNFV